MNQLFYTTLLNENGSIKTQTVNGSKNIVVHADKEHYDYDEAVRIADTAIHKERRQYGWEVRFKDGDQLKEVFIRGYGVEKCNETTCSKETLHEWIDRLYDKDNRQVSLF